MERDARSIVPETRLQADVCIIGAGPAGLTLARELAELRGSVILLESGGPDADGESRSLNDGEVIGSPYAGLCATRYRQVGGTAHLWNTSVAGLSGAKYVPLDHIDFEQRVEIPTSGWPFDRGHLDPYYRRAHTVCGLGAFDDDASRWSGPGRPCLTVRDVGDLTTGVYHVGVARQFTVTHPATIRASENTQLIHRATCCALLTDGARRVIGVAAKSGMQRPFRVDARFFVLAAGAIENARLLLASGDGDAALGNQHGWLGRCFMEHPRDYALRLIPRSADVFREIAFYDLHRSIGDAWIIGRLALDESTLRSSDFPNASVTILPRRRLRPWVDPWIDRLDRALGPVGISLFRRPRTVGYGWSTTAVEKECDALQVLINLEQRPHPDNRVVLASRRDAFGVPRAELHWRWREEEQATVRRLRAHLAERLFATGLGSVEVSNEAIPDPNAHHHAGTTRMSVDPRQGVVDADCRVHGMDNLYVAGGSVFPTAGFANPTLTIVALAVRLADHLKARL
jgi:choline dehydrogenase-like flavoprotein